MICFWGAIQCVFLLKWTENQCKISYFFGVMDGAGLSRNDLIRVAPLPTSKKRQQNLCLHLFKQKLKSLSQKDLHFGFIFVRVLKLNLILNLEFTVELTQVFCYLLLIIIFLVHVLALQLSTSRLVTDAGISITEGRQKHHSRFKVLAIQRKIT